MAIAVSREGSSCALVLSGVVATDDARALLEAARTAEAATGDVVVRMSGLQSLGTPAIQVLLALRHALAERDRTLRLEGVPPALSDRWRRAGLDGLTGRTVSST